MAARSPSVHLRKTLYRKDLSVDRNKCPNTVPAKPSRSRISKLAMISSIAPKGNANIRSKEAKGSLRNMNATPKAMVKAKESSVVSSAPPKALTERKKQLWSPASFRSVQNPRSATIKVSENRIVAKTLVFQSPKKLVKLKRSVELSSSVKKLCNGMRRLEIEKKRDCMGITNKVLGSCNKERRILKEANMEKKPQYDLVKEETANIMWFHGENLGHQPVRLEKNTTSRLKASRGKSTALVYENVVDCKRVQLGKKKQVV